MSLPSSAGRLRPAEDYAICSGLRRYFIERDAQRLRHTRTISRIGLQAVANVTLPDLVIDTCQLGGGVVEQHLLLLRGHEAEQLPGWV